MWMHVGDDSYRPMEWCRGDFLQWDQVIWLDIRRCPSATDDAVAWLCRDVRWCPLPVLAAENPVECGMTIGANTVEVVVSLPSGMSIAYDRCQQKVIGQLFPIRVFRI